jgi:hypothetical protein
MFKVVDIRHTRRIEETEVIICLITQFSAFMFDVLNERLLLRLIRNSILLNRRSLYIVVWFRPYPIHLHSCMLTHLKWVPVALILVFVTLCILHVHRFINDCSYKNCTWPGTQTPRTSLCFTKLKMQGKQFPTLCSETWTNISCLAPCLCVQYRKWTQRPMTRVQ